MSLTGGKGLVGRTFNSAGGAFDPATLALTGWWSASYVGDPWDATSSAGTSSVTGELDGQGGTLPSVGSALNGLTPVDYNGIDSYSANSNNFIGTITSVSAFSISALVYVRNAGTASVGTAYNEPALASDSANGFLNLSFSTRGWTLSCFDSAFGYVEAPIACPTGAWHLVQAWFDGSNLNISVDDGAPSTAAMVNPLTAVGIDPMWVGVNFDGTMYLDAKVAELMTSDVDLGATARTNIKSYCNTKFGLSL